MERKNMERNSLIAYTLVALAMVNLQKSCHLLGVEGGDTLRLGDSLRGNQTILSKNGTFVLGFFSPDGTTNRYISIWYANISERTIVWVANRENPVRNSAGVLKVSGDGYLGVFDGEGAPVWSPNVSKKASRAVMLDTGNFLVLGGDNMSQIIWQSFDHPGDSWLPGMKLDRRQKLVSWKNSSDPAPGFYSFEIDPCGAQQFVLRWNNSVQYGESLYSNVGQFGFRSEDCSTAYLTHKSRIVLNMNGVLRQDNYSDYNTDQYYYPDSTSHYQFCLVYNLCGGYGKCDVYVNSPDDVCSCVEGFRPRYNRAWDLKEWWSSGCVRRSLLNCDLQNGSTDGFIESIVELPNNPAYSYPARTKKECETACLRNCSCTAFSYTDEERGPCQIWSGDLFNLRKSFNSSSLFVRVADVDGSRFEPDPSSSSQRKTTTVVVSVSLLAAFAFALLTTFLLWRRRRLSSTQRSDDSFSASLRMFSYTELKIATNNFKYKLGSGGFGSVFKGTLTDTTLVAVKKLEGSRIAEKQFRAEISSVGNIQHVNLIRLQGFCAQGSHRLLVYDCMPNGSLSSFLFSQGKTLDWSIRFGIALGTARGLHYLHEKCRDRIIHGDVKPENILLDADYSPKLGDFGLAKLVGRDFSHVLTTTRGTRGYLAPEWISGLPITPKVDVYSFGMTLLEIISGRRNLDLTVQDSSKYYFPTWAATEIHQGNMMNIVDKRIAHNACVEEVRRATLVSLLCIQNEEDARPSMGQVLLMLEGIDEAHALQVPTHCEDHQIDSGNSDSD